ncbi:zinc finger protein 615 isoform X4 [Ceratitis capitata]|uniref:zinc finger protein 615 isoform X4 n=1 Tax=Ceratitis capitata TaxID=7213 RepID=UPI000A107E67|nr:zinc finger protein 615 isoform X4 [Ceratitis capitata]
MQTDEGDISSSLMTTEYVDLSDYCRLCLQLPDETQVLNLELIYDEEEQLTYYDCFVICTQIDLRADGINKPQQLCKSCGLELQVAYDFHKKVEESKKFLMQIDKTQNLKEQALETKLGAEEIPLEQEIVEGVPQSTTEKIDNDIATAEGDATEHLDVPVDYEELEEHIDIEEYQSVEELADEEQMEYIIIKEAHSESQDIILPELITDETSSIFTDSNLNHQSHQTEDVKVPVQYSLTNTSDSMKPNKYLKSPNAVYDSQIANIELAEIQSLPTKIIHTKREKRICCAYCSKTFPSQSKMLWHQRMHEPDRPRFSCPSEGCDRTYISRQSCELHYKQMHCSRDEFQPLECMLCHKKFAIPQTLEVHMRYHTRQFPFGCSQCERRFAQKGHLTSHMQVKHNNLRYICPEEGCGAPTAIVVIRRSQSLKFI